MEREKQRSPNQNIDDLDNNPEKSELELTVLRAGFVDNVSQCGHCRSYFEEGDLTQLVKLPNGESAHMHSDECAPRYDAFKKKKDDEQNPNQTKDGKETLDKQSLEAEVEEFEPLYKKEARLEQAKYLVERTNPKYKASVMGTLELLAVSVLPLLTLYHLRSNKQDLEEGERVFKEDFSKVDYQFTFNKLYLPMADFILWSHAYVLATAGESPLIPALMIAIYSAIKAIKVLENKLGTKKVIQESYNRLEKEINKLRNPTIE